MSCCKKTESKPFTEYSIIKAGKSVIKHFTDPTYNAFVDNETKNYRIETCRSCDKLESFFGKERCKICLCFIEAKASLVEQTCPYPDNDKWKRKEEFL